MKSRGYAGRRFTGKRRIDFPTPGMPNKHAIWAGVSIGPNDVVDHRSFATQPKTTKIVRIKL